MNPKYMIKSLNMTGGEVLTLEKAEDRMEFEALPIMDFNKDCGVNFCYCDSDCGVYVDCKPFKGSGNN